MSSALEMPSLAGEPKSNMTLSPLAGKPAEIVDGGSLARREGCRIVSTRYLRRD